MIARAIWIASVAAFAALAIACGGGKDSTEVAQERSHNDRMSELDAKQKSLENKIESVKKQMKGPNLNKYENLREGDTYEKVVEIIGEPGEEMSRNSLGGTVTVMYTWKRDDGSGGNMNAVFQNNQLVSKAQFGLKKVDQEK